MHRRRYEELAIIPRELKLIQELIGEADQQSEGNQARVTAIIAAAEKALQLMARLTGSPPLWLAMQRQFLVHDWSFKDLKELNNLPVDADPLVKVLTDLNSSLPPERRRRAPNPRQLVEVAWHDFHQVRDQAIANMEVSGLAIKDGDGLWVQVRDASVVERTHYQLRRLYVQLDLQLDDARQYESQLQPEEEPSQAQLEEADRESERRWQGVLEICVDAVTVVASITTVIVQAPEVWHDIEPYATELVRMVGQVGEALSRQVALLGMVIAIRQVDQALGIDPGGRINRPSALSKDTPVTDLRSGLPGLEQAASNNDLDPVRDDGRSGPGIGRRQPLDTPSEKPGRPDIVETLDKADARPESFKDRFEKASKRLQADQADMDAPVFNKTRHALRHTHGVQASPSVPDEIRDVHATKKGDDTESVPASRKWDDTTPAEPTDHTRDRSI